MKSPTHQELFDYTDGTLPDVRRDELEAMISKDPSLAREVEVLRSLRTAMTSGEMFERTSKQFTGRVMDAVLPQRSESVSFKLVQNSGNILSMAVVLTLIVLAYRFIQPQSAPSSGILSESFNAFSNLYQNTVDAYTRYLSTALQPVTSKLPKGPGNFILIGIGVFLGLGLLDEFVRKRFFR
jgi:anti-sigma factor RsiW